MVGNHAHPSAIKCFTHGFIGMNVVFEAIETGFFLYSYYLSNDEADEGRLFENWPTVWALIRGKALIRA